ncbi:MAG TPA: hypothetical protein VKN18_12510 [Blastocatellia bacterium]|nr:hypothetical protein [Blastocatellia bacterium]
MKTAKRVLLIIALGYFATGCWFFDQLNPSGFTIKTVVITPPSPTQRQMINNDPNVQVIGNWQGDNGFGSICGSQQTLNITTGSDGTKRISDGRVPAVWIFTRSGGHTGCGTIFNILRAISCAQTTTLECTLTGSNFGISPASIDVNAPPATALLSGQGLNTTYGTPTVEFYDEYGSYLDGRVANTVSSDGTWLEATMPGLSGAYSGTYTIVILNATSDGSREVVGIATVWIYGNDAPVPPPDPVPDPCLQGSPDGPAPECTPVVY